MEEPPAFLADPETTRESIMRATYLALCEYGYTGLTVQRIGEEFKKSKSLLYHHYDDKDELLLAFLQFMLEEYKSTVSTPESDGPAERLNAVLDTMLAPSLSEHYQEFTAAMVELRAQAAHDERYREQFAEHDRLFHDQLSSIIQTGIESDIFRAVDPDRAATLLLTTVVGTMTRRVTGDDDAAAVRAETEAYIDGILRSEE